jgi:Isochorismatase family
MFGSAPSSGESPTNWRRSLSRKNIRKVRPKKFRLGYDASFSRAGASRINASAVERDVLIIIDPQVDFCPGGALAVPGGDEIVPTVNQLARDFPHIVLTRDWHPPGTTFSSAPTLAGFKTIEVDYGAQTLWPDHCVQGTKQNGQRRPKRH